MSGRHKLNASAGSRRESVRQRCSCFKRPPWSRVQFGSELQPRVRCRQPTRLQVRLGGLLSHGEADFMKAMIVVGPHRRTIAHRCDRAMNACVVYRSM